MSDVLDDSDTISNTVGTCYSRIRNSRTSRIRSLSNVTCFDICGPVFRIFVGGFFSCFRGFSQVYLWDL